MAFTRLAAATACLTCVAATVVFAQDDPRRTPEGAPRLLLNAGGHTNQVRALVFSADSQRLYSAGLDKVVFGWEIRERGRRRRTITADPVQSLHWEISRGMRGAVVDLATASPAGERLLAIGGVSARGQGGDIMLYDAAQGVTKTTLDGLQSSLATGGLALSPDGSRLAAVSVLGDLWLWSVADFSRRQLSRAETTERPYRAITFLDNDTLAAAIPIGRPGADQWGIAIYDLSRGVAAPRLLRFVHEGAITTIVRDSNSLRWATADKGGSVYLWEGTEEQQPQVLRSGREALDVAFGPDETLFVATRLQQQLGVGLKPGQENEGAEVAFLEHWRLSPPQKVDEVQTSFSLDNYACTVSPDLKWLACCGDEKSPILVFALRDGNGNVLESPLTGRDSYKLPLKGVGESLGKVAFADDGSYQIGFGPHEFSLFNAYGDVERVFDLSRGVLLREAEHPPRFRSPTAGATAGSGADSGDWTVEESRDRRRLDLSLKLDERTYKCFIQLDPDKQGQAQCYCFLSHRQRPFAVAVGTNHQNGIFIYQLVPDGECPLLRYYRDHSNVVFSLSVSADGRYLASASFDQTVKIWSLDGLVQWEDIAADRQRFKRAPAWGAVFEQRPQGVLVARTRKAGIAAGRKMQPGDVIVRLDKVENGAVRSFTTPADIFAALERSTVFEQLSITVRRNGKDIALPQIVPAWEPAATLFADIRGEWALFTPQGPYAASPAGGELFGWQFNMGRDVTPEFLTAEQLRGQFEQPDTLRQLFLTGDMAAAIARTRGATVNLDGLLSRALMRTPDIQILTPLDGSGPFGSDEEITIRARIVYPLGTTPAQYQVRAYLNAAAILGGRRQPSALEEIVSWRTSAPETYNALLVEVTEGTDPDAPPGRVFAEKSVVFRAEPSQGKPRLHMFTIAADEYPQAFAVKYTVADGEGLAEDLQKYTVGLYEKGNVYPPLLNRRITVDGVRRQIDQILADLEKTARPDDLLVMYVGGHGVAIGDEFYFVPPDDRFRNLEDAQIAKFGVPWTELRRLADVPCRKVVFLNACHSGNVVDAEKALEQERTSLKALREAHMLIVTATQSGRLAIEPPDSQHGFFMARIREGLSGHADGELSEEDERRVDGIVNLRELVRYVTATVQKDTATYAEYGPQTPSHSPLHLFRSLDIPLAQYEQPASLTTDRTTAH
ncbi:MAG: caspase family protein [Planctomycetes bacterium]|nr:caspase family protein [Planctomycetota bacterium]